MPSTSQGPVQSSKVEGRLGTVQGSRADEKITTGEEWRGPNHWAACSSFGKPLSSYLRSLNGARHTVCSGLLAGNNCLESCSGSKHWQDPSTVYKNNVPHHTPLRLLGSKADAFASVSTARGETQWVKFIAHSDKPAKCLFQLYPNPAACPSNVAALAMEDTSGWEESEIPSNWQFKVPHRDPPVYTNRAFP